MEAIVRREHIEASTMLTCVRNPTGITVRTVSQSESRVRHDHSEIALLVGVLSINKSQLHLPGSNSLGADSRGHLLDDCNVHAKLELVLMTYLVHERQTDSTFGYKELTMRKKSRK